MLEIQEGSSPVRTNLNPLMSLHETDSSTLIQIRISLEKFADISQLEVAQPRS